MLPTKIVTQHYTLFPTLREYQEEAVNELAPIDRMGIYLDVGTGKTITSIVIALYKLIIGDISRVICLMPPILITNWYRTLSKIPGVSAVAYKGSPAARKKIDLDSNFILMSYQIFKKDWDYLAERFGNERVAVICDEAQAVKNVGSDTYKKVRDFTDGNVLMLLTGTPLSAPLDAYAYIKQVSPTIYRNQLQFEQIHVKEYDFFKKPKEWQNIDLLRENLKVNSVRILKEDVLHDLPPVSYVELSYDLEDKHKRLYKEIAENQLKVLGDGSKLDFTQVSSLFNALQQIPANAEHFSGGDVNSTIYELIDEIMDELGGGKLVLFTKYIMTNRRLLEKFKKYGAVALYSEVSPKQQQANLDRFVNDPECRLICLQYQSGGAGIDGLQEVCNEVMFIELPPTAAHFTQAVARVHRSGQHLPTTVRIAIAEGTLQPYLWDVVQDKDSLINLCIRGPANLRDVVLGVRKSQ